MEKCVDQKVVGPEGGASETSSLPSSSWPARRRFAIVGTGGRSGMFLNPIVSRYSEASELVALCDRSAIRMRYQLRRLAAKYGAEPLPLYLDTQFDEMLRIERPDTVIVCTPDATHHDYLIRAVDAGCDVIVEKPLTTDAGKCRAIFDAVQRTGQHVAVTFNLRWSPGFLAIRRLLRSGELGRVFQVNMEYLLDIRHGADYFRRWHSEKESSGGLLVHKSCHHFDLVNWILDEIPEEVFAFGGLHFYGEENALRRGAAHLTGFDRYTGREKNGDPFHFSLADDPHLRSLYLEAEEDSGYIRDRNVFRRGINIEDSLAVLVRYVGGAVLNYSLNTYSPLEGMRVSFTGEKGRLEYSFLRKVSAATLHDGAYAPILTFTPLVGEARNIAIEAASGGHGGADPKLQEYLFSGDGANADGSAAGYGQAIYSTMIGIAANHSLVTGRPASISELLGRRPPASAFGDLP